MTRHTQSNLLGLSLSELAEIAPLKGQAAFRARQLYEAIYRQRVAALDEITSLPLSLRSALAAAGYGIELPVVDRMFTSVDGTIRYLIRFADGRTVETVWMPEGDDGEAGDGSEADGDGETDQSSGAGNWRRATICVSSQVGCAVNCQFCFTAQLGLERNLTAGEIAGQVLAVLKDRSVNPSLDRVNLVFMGQGEPFHNYDEFMNAVRLLVEGTGIPQSRMTVSTAGIVPRIYDFGREAVRPKLAISLNASNDLSRSEIMPLNRKWKIAELMQAAREFPLRPRERLTFEYVLLEGVNDSVEHAREVIRLVRDIRAKVNLIAFNSGPGLGYTTPEQERVLQFQRVLVQAGVPAFIRKPRGRDIYAACGQLKRTMEERPAESLLNPGALF
jgi:23S rRNA (adenine2503-C2)-methyltransferase